MRLADCFLDSIELNQCFGTKNLIINQTFQNNYSNNATMQSIATYDTSNVGKISDCCLVKLHLTYPSNVDRADRRQTGSPVPRLEIRRSNPIIDSFYWSISLLLIGPDERLASVTRLGHFFTDLATYLHTKVGQIFDNFWPVLISVTFIVTTTVATFGQFWKNIGLLLLQHLFPQL